MERLRKTLIAVLGLIFMFAAPGCKKDVEACFTISKSQSNSFKIHFNSDCSEGAVAFDWEFGDGGTSISASPSHTYLNAGDYAVTLRITSKKGEMSTTTHWVEIEEVCDPCCVSCVCYVDEDLIFDNEFCGNDQEVQDFCDTCPSTLDPFDCSCD